MVHPIWQGSGLILIDQGRIFKPRLARGKWANVRACYETKEKRYSLNFFPSEYALPTEPLTE